MSKVYVCGAMTPTRFDEQDRSDHAYDDFFVAANALEAAGHIAYNPATNKINGVEDPTYKLKSKEEWAAFGPAEYKREYILVMERDLRWIMECDGMTLLPGWRRSQGARFEHEVAAFLHREITNVKEWVEKGQDSPATAKLAGIRHAKGWVEKGRIEVERRESLTPGATPLGSATRPVVVPTGPLPVAEEATRVQARQIAEQAQAVSERSPNGSALIHEGALEVPHHFGDAGHDLTSTEEPFVHLAKGQFRDVDCSLRVQLPPGTWGLITGRSSTFRQRGIHVVQGVVDNGYRGPIKVGMWNTSNADQYIKPGDQLAQLIVMPLLRFPLEEGVVPEEAGDGRGVAGFGSTSA